VTLGVELPVVRLGWVMTCRAGWMRVTTRSDAGGALMWWWHSEWVWAVCWVTLACGEGCWGVWCLTWWGPGFGLWGGSVVRRFVLRQFWWGDSLAVVGWVS
jgi:hypothetical protein